MSVYQYDTYVLVTVQFNNKNHTRKWFLSEYTLETALKEAYEYDAELMAEKRKHNLNKLIIGRKAKKTNIGIEGISICLQSRHVLNDQGFFVRKRYPAIVLDFHLRKDSYHQEVSAFEVFDLTDDFDIAWINAINHLCSIRRLKNKDRESLMEKKPDITLIKELLPKHWNMISC